MYDVDKTKVSHKKNGNVEKDSVRFGVKVTIELGSIVTDSKSYRILLNAMIVLLRYFGL